ncbi:MAG: AgmX/PglI C-terminal domain-containing protein [bacterium]
MNDAEKNPRSVNDYELDDYDTSESDFFEPKIIEFPREFRKSFSDRIDQRFITFLIASILAHIMLVSYFLLNPPSMESRISKLAKIQQRLAKMLVEREAPKEALFTKFDFSKERPVEEAEEADKEKSSETELAEGAAPKGKATKTTKRSQLRSARRGRAGGKGTGRSQKEIAAAIGSKGILALLTSTSSVASGEEVEDILFRSGNSEQDLDKALSNLSGIKTGGMPSRSKGGSGDGGDGVKGERAQEGGGIDQLVSGLGTTKSRSFERSGELVVVSDSPLIEGNGEKGILGRNQDDIQAVVLKHKNAIQYCYERALKRNPNLKGKLVVRFTITPQGAVKKLTIVSSTISSRKVERCVMNRIRRWNDFGSIDPSYGDTTIRQVFAFGY